MGVNTINGHKDLKVWKEAMDLVIDIYEISKSFPETEKYALTSQMKRSAISIPSNIAEGFGRKGNRELMQFLYISLGSLSELETQLEIANRLAYINNPPNTFEKIKFIRVLLTRLIESIKKKTNAS